MIKACLFDIGNVLVTFDFRRSFNRFGSRSPKSLEEIGRHLAAAGDGLETGRLSSDEFVASAVEFIGGDITAEDFRAAFTGFFEIIPPVWKLVEAIRHAVPLYLFSNTSELHEACLFKNFPEFNHFHGGIYSWRVGSMKPHDGMYQHAITTLGVQGNEIAYIDDLPANIETGKRCDFRCHQYDRTRHDELVRFLDECGLPVSA